MAKRKATAEELEARAESNGHKRGAHREKDSARDDGKHNDKTKTNQNVVLDRYVVWTLLQMRKDALQRDLPTPDEACARHHCLHQGVEAPDLATLLPSMLRVVVGEHWNGHCQEYLSAIASKRCGSITYCHTLVRPGYCPFHLGNQRLLASERCESWTRDRKLWEHLDEHISEVQDWPSPCPHPLCDLSMKDAAEMQYPFIDDHGMCRTRLTAAVQQDNGDVHRAAGSCAARVDGYLSSRESPRVAKSQRRLTKPSQEASPTICPKLLTSSLEQTLGPDLQTPFSVAVFDYTSTSDCTDFEFADGAINLKEKKTQKRVWQPDSPDYFNWSSADMYVDSGAIFSDYLRSRSSSPSIFQETQDCNAKPDVGLPTNTSASISSAAPCAAAFMDNDPNRLHEERQVKCDGRRIQLRIKPSKAPKITLRLAHPKRGARAKGSRKRA